MKKTIYAAIGGCRFIIDEDAYNELNNYLLTFSSNAAVSEDIEARVAYILKGRIGESDVVDIKIAQDIIDEIGYPEGFTRKKESGSYSSSENILRKLFRNPDDKKIAGVCSGLAIYFGVDVTIIRILFLIGLIGGLAGFWIYLILWIAAPEANTAAEKCELRGLPVTPENIRRFS